MMETKKEAVKSIDEDAKTWFSMWFLASIVSFGLGFFPMFHRIVNGRNLHFQRETVLNQQVAAYMKSQGKQPPALVSFPNRNAKAWAASIILIIPTFVIMYLLSKDLVAHERQMDTLLADAFPKKMFMTQTVPIKTYAILTVVTLGVGGIYWLYKIVNLYNAHYKAQWHIEQEITRLMEEAASDKHM
jgi:hypothetical protein